MNMPTLRFFFALGCAAVFGGCASSRFHVPPTNSTYTVSAAGSGTMSGVETVEIMGDWVLLDGRRLIPKDKIEFIRADRELPSERKAKGLK